MGEGTGAMEGTAVGGDRDEPYAGRTTKRLTGGAGLPAGVIAQESCWRVGSARQREGARSGCARGSKSEMGRKGGSGRGMGWIQPS
jgi:hypothetical protein